MMSKAEVRAKIQALGLTHQQIAEDTGTQLHTVQDVSNPNSDLQPPAPLTDYLEQKWQMHLRQAATVEQAIADQTKEQGHPPERVELRAYASNAALHDAGHNLTTQEHDALLAHTMLILDRANIDYSVHYQPMP